MIENSITEIYSHTDKRRGLAVFNSTESTSEKGAKSSQLSIFNHRIIFALLWANFCLTASQQISVQTTALSTNGKQKTWLAFLALPSSGKNQLF